MDGKERDDHFGTCLSAAPDMNGDGVTEWLVGAPGASSAKLSRCGIVYIVSGATGSIVSEMVGDKEYGAFGTSIDTATDLDNDGAVDIIIGAPGATGSRDSRNGAACGTVYAVSGKTLARLCRIDGKREWLDFGWSVCGILPSRTPKTEGRFLVGSPYAASDAENGEGLVVAYEVGDSEPVWVGRARIGEYGVGWKVWPIGDCDSDGDLDVVVRMLGAGSGPSVPGRTSTPRSLAVCNGVSGRRRDMAWADRLQAAGGMTAIGVADVDGDGISEVVVVMNSPSKAAVPRIECRAAGDGRIVFESECPSGVGRRPAGFGVAKLAGSKQVTELLVGWRQADPEQPAGQDGVVNSIGVSEKPRIRQYTVPRKGGDGR